MKFLKKFIVVILTSLMSLSCFTIYASELNYNKSLVGYCASNHDCDQYALDNADLLASSLDITDNKVVLGNPLTIFCYDDNDIQLYPFISNDTVVATLEVYNVNGTIGGSFSENYVDFLNESINLTSSTKPLYLYRNATGIYGVIDSTTYPVALSRSTERSIVVTKDIDTLDINDCFDGQKKLY